MPPEASRCSPTPATTSPTWALAIALGAAWLARRPPTLKRSFGYKRAEILAAFLNAITLVVIGALIVFEAIRRFGNPPDVPGGWMIAVATVGVLINAAGAAEVYRRGGEDLNLRLRSLCSINAPSAVACEGNT